jgi:carboxymethylenebutenolidase
MKERTVEISTPDGKMPTFVIHPEDGGPFPAVVLYMDVWGIREELFEVARRVATVGYACVVPDFYYRQGKIGHLFRDEKNRMISLHNLDAESQDKVVAPMLQLSDAMVVSDTGALIEFFKNDQHIRGGAAGCIGYCMGGRHVLCAAGHYPETFTASACLHGTFLITDEPDSPHLLAGKFRGELYCGYAEHDRFTPPPLVKQMDEILAPLPVDYRYEVHAGADHGYALPDRDIFDARAAARDWEIIFAMFRRRLAP